MVTYYCLLLVCLWMVTGDSSGPRVLARVSPQGLPLLSFHPFSASVQPEVKCGNVEWGDRHKSIINELLLVFTLEQQLTTSTRVDILYQSGKCTNLGPCESQCLGIRAGTISKGCNLII